MKTSLKKPAQGTTETYDILATGTPTNFAETDTHLTFDWELGDTEVGVVIGTYKPEGVTTFYENDETNTYLWWV